MLVNRIRCVYTTSGLLGIIIIVFHPPPPIFPLVPPSILVHVLHNRCKVKSYFFVPFTPQIRRGLDIFLAIYNVLLWVNHKSKRHEEKPSVFILVKSTDFYLEKSDLLL